MNYYGHQFPNSDLISLDELYLQILVKSFGCWGKIQLNSRKLIPTSMIWPYIWLGQPGARFLPRPTVECSPWWNNKIVFSDLALVISGFWIFVSTAVLFSQPDGKFDRAIPP